MRKLIEAALITLNGVVTNQAKWSGDYFDAEEKPTQVRHSRSATSCCWAV
jgi:hypothetical protein